MQLLKIYRDFNEKNFSPEKHQRVLEAIAEAAGETCVRLCETPVFLPRSFVAETVAGATEIIHQALALGAKLDPAVLPEFRLQRPPEKPSFFIIDFAVTAAGPRLIELQAFASNLAFIPKAAEIYSTVYGLKHPYLLCDDFAAAVKKTVLGGYAPEDVILMEINPWAQQSRRDFVVTRKLLGLPVVDITDVIREGDRLFYIDAEGKQIRIRRIYNRVVPDEYLQLRMQEKTQFKFTDDLDVEWAGDPGWFLRVSKYALPFLRHPLVPETRFLSQIAVPPPDLENYVLKPFFSNAGGGVRINVTQADLGAVENPAHYLLMRKVQYMPFIPDPKGNMLNAEVRVMFVRHDRLEPVALSARVMRGNDVNANLWGDDAWCGMAPVLIV